MTNVRRTMVVAASIVGLVVWTPAFAGECQIEGSANPPATGNIFVAGALAEGYDIGIDTDQQRRDWLSCGGSECADCCRMRLPEGQQWGALFITIGKAAEPPRPAQDFGEFRFLQVELRGETGGESVQVGIKDACDPDNGAETKETLAVTSDWQTYNTPLDSLASADLHQLYVVTEFVFDSSPGGVEAARTVSFRAVRFLTDICGDATGEGAVTVSDGVQALRAAAELSSSCTLARCDVDGSGAVTLTDGIQILRAAAALPIEANCP